MSFHNLKTDAKQPYFEELEDLLNESKTLVLIPDEVVLLRNLVDDISFFRKKIRAFLASDPTDLITIKNFLRCAEGLQVILTPDLDRLRVKVTTFLSEEEKTKKWCVCQTLYDESRPMIACDECDEWFHWSCMNLSPVVAQQMETFICSACLDQTVMLKVPAIQAVSDEQHPNKKLKPQENSVDI